MRASGTADHRVARLREAEPGTLMNKLIVASLISAALTVAAPAAAQRKQTQNIDFGAISCQQFLEDVSNASEDDVGAIMLWLDGYLSGVSGDAVLRFGGLEQFGQNLVTHCANRGSDRLLDAARMVGIQ